MLALDKLYENKVLLFSAGAVALLVAALLILFIFRLAFGRRLHMSGAGRSRQPRLGIVDAFDLDRQRQLILVRRDNVEHLVMIGGPNDLLIESQIIRADARAREKEATVPPLAWTGNAPAGDQQALLPQDFPVAARNNDAGIGAGPSVTSVTISSAMPSLSSGSAFSASQPLSSAAPPISSAPAVSSIPMPSSQTAPAPPLVVPSEGAPSTPTVPAAPKRPSFLPPRRPLATPTFGTKTVPTATDQAAPPVLGPATNDCFEGPLQDSLNPALVAPPPPLPGGTLPPLKPLGPAPSFLRPRPGAGPAIPPVRPSMPASGSPPPVNPPSAAPALDMPAIEPQTKPDKLTEAKDGPSMEPDALDTLEEEMAKLLGRNLERP